MSPRGPGVRGEFASLSSMATDCPGEGQQLKIPLARVRCLALAPFQLAPFQLASVKAFGVSNLNAAAATAATAFDDDHVDHAGNHQDSLATPGSQAADAST